MMAFSHVIIDLETEERRDWCPSVSDRLPAASIIVGSIPGAKISTVRSRRKPVGGRS